MSDFVSKNLTSNATSSSTQTITVSDNSGIEVGDFVIGNGIPSGTTVTNISGTTITISNRLASGSVITSGTEISFKNAKLNGYSMVQSLIVIIYLHLYPQLLQAMVAV